MLTHSGDRRAVVLLSDGSDNEGCDPDDPAKPSALRSHLRLTGSRR